MHTQNAPCLTLASRGHLCPTNDRWNHTFFWLNHWQFPSIITHLALVKVESWASCFDQMRCQVAHLGQDTALAWSQLITKQECYVWESQLNTLRPRQDGRHFADDIFKCLFLNENVWISIKISLKFVPKGPIYNIPALVQIMACRCPGDKPISEGMMVNLPTHVCVSRTQWVNYNYKKIVVKISAITSRARAWLMIEYERNKALYKDLLY